MDTMVKLNDGTFVSLSETLSSLLKDVAEIKTKLACLNRAGDAVAKDIVRGVPLDRGIVHW